MVRLLVILAVVAVALTVFTIVNIALAASDRVRGVPKPLWVLIAFVPFVGPILWFGIGNGPADGGTARRVAPDDDPAFLRNLGRDEEVDERIRRLEQELAELDDEPPADK